MYSSSPRKGFSRQAAKRLLAKRGSIALCDWIPVCAGTTKPNKSAFS